MIAALFATVLAETPAEREARLLEEQAAEAAEAEIEAGIAEQDAASPGEAPPADEDEDAGKGQGGERWKKSPILKPDLGLAMYASGGDLEVGLSIGAQVGLSYAKRGGWLAGRTRAGGAVVRTLGGAGTDLRVGSFLGPQGKLLGLDVGLDLFRNGYDGVVVSLDESVGVDLPVTVRVGPRLVHGIFNVTPAWLDQGSRRVDWATSEGWGFGHEFGWLLGAAISTPILGVYAGWSERYVAGGTSKGLYAGVSFGR